MGRDVLVHREVGPLRPRPFFPCVPLDTLSAPREYRFPARARHSSGQNRWKFPLNLHTFFSSGHQPGGDPVREQAVEDTGSQEQHGPGIIMGGYGHDAELEAHKNADPAAPYCPVQRDRIGKTDQEPQDGSAVHARYHKPGFRRNSHGRDDQQASGSVQAGQDADEGGYCYPLYPDHNPSGDMGASRLKNIAVCDGISSLANTSLGNTDNQTTPEQKSAGSLPQPKHHLATFMKVHR